MKKWLMILFVGIVTMVLQACDTSSLTTTLPTTETSTTTLTTTSTTTTTTSATTTTQPTTSTTSTTTAKVIAQSLVISELAGEGTKTLPYTLEIKEEELIQFTISVLPMDYQGVLSFSLGLWIDDQFVSTDLPILDLSGSTAKVLKLKANQVGNIWIRISVDQDIERYVQVTVKPWVDFTQSLKILAIGNSFSEDAMNLLYKIAANAGIPNIVIGNLYIGGSALDTHVTKYNYMLPDYIYYKNTNDNWTSRNGSNIMYGILDEDWDIITIQQVSGKSGLPDTYDPYLGALIQIVMDNKTNPNARIYWHMTWAYQQNSTHGDFRHYGHDQMTMYEAIIQTAQEKIVPRPEIKGLIPAGTAIQNLRTSHLGDTLTRDGYHLSLTKGRYAAALTWFAYITPFDIDEITYKPADVSEKDFLAIKEAVKNAILSPFEITESIYKPDENTDPVVNPSDSISGLFQVSYQLGFWNSTSSHLFLDGDSISKNFIGTTKRFSKAELPLGTLIIIEEGYQFRANFWTGVDGPLNLSRRTDNFTNTVIVVNEAFWGSQDIVAFNVSVVGTPDATSRLAEIASKMHFVYPFKPIQLGLELGYYSALQSISRISSNQWISTKRLTPSDLPYGSLLFLDPEYQYQVSYYLNDQDLTGNIQTETMGGNLVVLDETWWKQAQFVSISISKEGETDLSSLLASNENFFKLYQPFQTILSFSGTIGYYTALLSHQIVTNAPISNQNVATTIRFSKADLPVGSILFIDSGYQYTPSFYMNLDGELTGNRQGLATTSRILFIDEAWWGEHQFVGFTIRPIQTADLTNQNSTVVSKFRIYRTQ